MKALTDKKLLELAAKSAGIEFDWCGEGVAINHGFGECGEHHGKWVDVWNPLTDDGDALRLAVDLRLEIDIGHDWVAIRHFTGFKIIEALGLDAQAATRRAIIRAAAEIGITEGHK